MIYYLFFYAVAIGGLGFLGWQYWKVYKATPGTNFLSGFYNFQSLAVARGLQALAFVLALPDLQGLIEDVASDYIKQPALSIVIWSTSKVIDWARTLPKVVP